MEMAKRTLRTVSAQLTYGVRQVVEVDNTKRGKEGNTPAGA
jgi:hypothetical protein